jgi:hypothetical protein
MSKRKTLRERAIRRAGQAIARYEHPECWRQVMLAYEAGYRAAKRTDKAG